MDFIQNTKEMASGKRNLEIRPLTSNEIDIVIKAGKRIGIVDKSIYIFNDKKHIESPHLGTGYDYIEDKIYITMNVFPDDKYASSHPRDLMSVAAVLAHEYYGHRRYRNEYLNDIIVSQNNNEVFHTTPEWEDECRASVDAAKITPNLTDKERCDLIQDAVYRAHEYGQTFELDNDMKGILYGDYYEKPIVPTIKPIKYISEESIEPNQPGYDSYGDMPDMSEEDYDDIER